MRNELSKRLQAVADLVTVRECVADIGTDHAYIPIYLTEHKKVKKAFAMDVNEGPLIRAEEHVREAGLKYYPMMRVVPSKESEREKWDETQLRYGKLLLEMRHPILEQYLKREEQLKAEILEKLDHQRGEHITKRQAELKEELVCIRKGLKYYAV